MKQRYLILLLVILVAAPVLMTRCGKSEGGSNGTLELTIPGSNTVAAETTAAFMQVKASGDWTIEFSYPEGVEPWMDTDSPSGSGNKNNARLLFTRNTFETSRSVNVELRSKGRIVSEVFTQRGTTVVVDPNPTMEWIELPAIDLSDERKFVTHYTEINGKTVRNYSLLFDVNENISYWVAYPLHSSYRGSYSRSDNWTFDPLIPSQYQDDISRTGYGTGYDRGHQIPSADRNVNALTNQQTFYSSNATAQKSGFNQGVWAKLETKVRGWIFSTDTLYVVTGAVLKTVGGNETVNKSNKGSSIPNYYFKVIYSYSNNNHKAIGFWYDHNKNYSKSDQINSVTDIKTVREIEELTGFDFFTHLPQQLQETIETSYRLQDWGF